jgi:hypothetical protein
MNLSDQVKYLSSSFALELLVFFLLGTGILHSIAKATQFVHGTPREAASQRTWRTEASQRRTTSRIGMLSENDSNIPYAHDTSAGLSIMLALCGGFASCDHAASAAEVLGLDSLGKAWK